MEERNERLQWQIDTDMFVNIVIELDEIFIKIQNKLKNCTVWIERYIGGRNGVY